MTPCKTCAWCSATNEGGNPFYCPACVKLHWSKAEPDKPPPAPPAKPSPVTRYYYHADRATGLGYQD